MEKENVMAKTQRIKINSLEFPTQDWDEFGKIFEILQKETILASNKIISACNVYNALGKENGGKWLFDTYGTDKIRSATYQAAKRSCKFYYSGSFGMISESIYKNYFSGKNSWKKKIDAGEGNPPMTYTDTIPLFVRGDQTKVECLNYERGFYSFQSSFLSPIAKKEGFDYVTYEYDENNKKKKIKHHIDVNETRLKFRFTVKKNSRLEELISSFMKENSEYKFGDSQLLRKKNKKTKRWDYWFMLAYSCPKQDPGKKLDENRVMGVDVGVVVPAYASINDMTYKKIPIGDNTIHKQKILDEKLRAEKQSAITYNLRDGHGRKTKLDGFDGAGHKSRNRQKTKNQVWAKKIVQEAIKYGCGNIYMEDLKGLKQQEKENRYLQNWDYFGLQTEIENHAHEYGIVTAKVNRFGTSQKCPCCGLRDKKNRPKGKMGQAYFKCIQCGYEDNADHVAAINISRSNPIKDSIRR